jgi:hypothetical protein
MGLDMIVSVAITASASSRISVAFSILSGLGSTRTAPDPPCRSVQTRKAVAKPVSVSA